MARELDLLRRELDLARSSGGAFHPHSQPNTQTTPSTTPTSHQTSLTQPNARPGTGNMNVFSHSASTPPGTTVGASSTTGAITSHSHGLSPSNTTPREPGANPGSGPT